MNGCLIGLLGFNMKRLLFLGLISAGLAANATIHIKGMVCDFCATTLDRAFKKDPTIQSVKTDLSKKTIQLTFKKNQTLSDDALTNKVKDHGYAVESISRS